MSTEKTTMMQEVLPFVAVIVSIGVCASLVIGTCHYFSQRETEMMIRNGYEWKPKCIGEWVKKEAK